MFDSVIINELYMFYNHQYVSVLQGKYGNLDLSTTELLQ